ncbi:MAG: tRNA (adenosine(37)-N6)-threonylcarbamoyltransferase complex dimerization subunit type 1 TsaB, partial [Candidatus Zixiibacteriota bacterium]
VKAAVPAEQSHSARLMKSIASLLNSAGCKVSDLSAMVVVTGPGSFTGLRIAIACAKGMAVALQIPVVGVNLFEVAAYKLAGESDKIQILLPFKKDAFFAAWIERGKLEELSISAMTSDEINKQSNGSMIAIVGEAGHSQQLSDQSRLLDQTRSDYDASDIIHLGLEKLKKNQIPELAQLEPMYIQKSQAEINLEKRQNRKD